MIKSIETFYKGHLMRSRLEARWGVFFSEMGIQWEYEPEGFEMLSGKRYLPDFWLPEYKVWFEVKPSVELITDYETDKIVEFISESESNLILCVGQPLDDKMYFLNGKSFNKNRDCYDENVEQHYKDYTNKKALSLVCMFSHYRVYFYSNPFMEPKFQITVMHDDNSQVYSYISNAYQKACSARFEFGENGQ